MKFCEKYIDTYLKALRKDKSLDIILIEYDRIIKY